MWFGLSLVGAVFQAGQYTVVKGWGRHLHPFTIMLWTQAVSLAAFAAWARLAGDSFAAPWRYMGWVLTAVGLAGAMNYLIARASARGDISIVGPILALSPIASIVPDWWLTGALPHGIGWVGVGASALGTVSLSRGEGRGFDVRGLFAREDVLCALGAAASLGALSAVDRKMTTLVGVPAYLAAIYLLQVPLTAALVWRRHLGALARSLDRHNAAPLAVHALFAVVGNALLLTALTLAPAAYVNSVRRVSSVISVLLGASLFGEPGLTGRLVGALLTGLGAACLLLAP